MKSSGNAPPASTSFMELFVADANEPSHHERQPWFYVVPD